MTENKRSFELNMAISASSRDQCLGEVAKLCNHVMLKADEGSGTFSGESYTDTSNYYFIMSERGKDD